MAPLLTRRHTALNGSGAAKATARKQSKDLVLDRGLKNVPESLSSLLTKLLKAKRQQAL